MGSISDHAEWTGKVFGWFGRNVDKTLSLGVCATHGGLGAAVDKHDAGSPRHLQWTPHVEGEEGLRGSPSTAGDSSWALLLSISLHIACALDGFSTLEHIGQNAYRFAAEPLAVAVYEITGRQTALVY